MLQLKNIGFSRGDKKILDGLDASAPSGQLTVLIGENGTGKTTLFDCITGILGPATGTISYKSNLIKPDSHGWNRQLSYILDDGGTIPLLTVEEQLILQCRLNGTGRIETAERADELIALLSLEHHRNHRAEELSAGLNKKLGIGLGFIRDADIYLFDEPFSSLDIQGAVILNYLLEILKHRGRTVIISTHTPSLVSDLCDRIWLLSNGRITEYNSQDKMQDFFSSPAATDFNPSGKDKKIKQELSWIRIPE